MIPHYCSSCLRVTEADVTPEGQSYCPHCHSQVVAIDRMSTPQILDALETLTGIIGNPPNVRTDIDSYPVH